MKIYPIAKLGRKFCQILNAPQRYSQRLLTLCQFGEILPSLVTLLPTATTTTMTFGRTSTFRKNDQWIYSSPARIDLGRARTLHHWIVGGEGEHPDDYLFFKNWSRPGLFLLFFVLFTWQIQWRLVRPPPTVSKFLSLKCHPLSMDGLIDWNVAAFDRNVIWLTFKEGKGRDEQWMRHDQDDEGGGHLERGGDREDDKKSPAA